MNTSSLHIITSWIPIYSLILSGLILAISLLLKRNKLFNLSMISIAFSALASFITGALGGASMAKVKELKDINHAALHLHAWSAFGAIAFAIILAILAIIRFRKKTQSDIITNIMMVIIGLLLLAFLVTSMNFATQIRP
jgi:uncharacterized membrane protein